MAGDKTEDAAGLTPGKDDNVVSSYFDDELLHSFVELLLYTQVYEPVER